MNRSTVQLLRYIHMRPGLSPRTAGVHKRELEPLLAQNLIRLEGGYWGPMEVTQKGKELLESLGARTFGNTEWDDEIFVGLLKRKSLHRPERVQKKGLSNE